MRIVFMGTPEYAVASLRALAGKHEVVGIVTQPDKPKGRHRVPSPPPVKACAIELGIAPDRILQPVKVNEPATVQALRALAPELYCVVAYGGLLKSEVLAIPSVCPLNAHGSLLPKFRGAAPIQAAILAGERETGVSLMRMELGMDTGPVMLERAIPIAETDTAGTLHDKLADLSARTFLEGLELIESGKARFETQDASQASCAPKLTKGFGALDWRMEAIRIERLVRACDPWPGATTKLALVPSRPPRPILIRSVRVVSAADLPGGSAAIPGTVLAADPARGIVVACGSGTALRLTRVQVPGKAAMDDTALMRGLR